MRRIITYFYSMRGGLGIFSFAYKSYAGLIFGATLLVFYPPIYILLTRETWKPKTMPLFSVWSRIIQVLILMPIQKHQTHQLPDGPFIVCANHSSYMDIVLMPSILRKINFLFVGKHEILSYPFINTFFKKLHIPVNREDKMQAARSYVKAGRSIKEGWSIVLFPEGGIPDGNRPKMIPFKPGAFKLALSTKVPIVPITFTNNYRLFSDPEDFFGPARPGIAKVIIHKPIYPSDYENLSAEELNQKVYEIIDNPLRELY